MEKAVVSYRVEKQVDEYNGCYKFSVIKDNKNNGLISMSQDVKYFSQKDYEFHKNHTPERDSAYDAAYYHCKKLKDLLEGVNAWNINNSGMLTFGNTISTGTLAEAVKPNDD